MFSDYKIGPQAMKFFQMGYQSQMEGRLEDAVYYYKKSLEIEETAEAHTFLGWTYSFMGKFEEAIQECRQAIGVDPDFGNPYNDIGSYLTQLGMLDDAILWLEKAKLAVRYATPEYAYFNLGQVYEIKGLWPKAMKEYHGALKINPHYEPAKAAFSRLKNRLN
jgi:tetratricopeptide (TPR) repeat protein